VAPDAVIGMTIAVQGRDPPRPIAGLRQVGDSAERLAAAPSSPGTTDDRKDHAYFYQYRHDQARRTLRGIDEQIGKAEKAVAGKIAVKRNRFVALSGATKTVNRTLETKASSLAGIKGK